MVEISNIKTFAVIGAGTMSREIAQIALMGGYYKVILNDISQEILDNAANYIDDGLKKLKAKGKLSQGFTTYLLMDRLIKKIDLWRYN